MNIYDYADTLGLTLIVKRYPNRGYWRMAFDNCETKDDPEDRMLSSPSGESVDVQAAIVNYITKIRGKILVINATGGADRREYVVPASLTLE